MEEAYKAEATVIVERVKKTIADKKRRRAEEEKEEEKQLFLTLARAIEQAEKNGATYVRHTGSLPQNVLYWLQTHFRVTKEVNESKQLTGYCIHFY